MPQPRDNWDACVDEVGEGTARVWGLYMAGSRIAFERNEIQLHHVLATKTDENGVSGYPLRHDLTLADPYVAYWCRVSTRAQQYDARVERRDELSPHLVRLTLRSTAFESTGIPDEWVGLVVPGQFQSRYYTVRSYDDGELVLDVVVHEVGLVTEWVVARRRRRRRSRSPSPRARSRCRTTPPG